MLAFSLSKSNLWTTFITEAWRNSRATQARLTSRDAMHMAQHAHKSASCRKLLSSPTSQDLELQAQVSIIQQSSSSSSSSSWHQSNLRRDYLEAEMDGAHIYAWGWKLSSVLAQKNEESWWRWNKKPQPRKEKMKFWCLHSYLGMFISNSCYFHSLDKQEDGSLPLQMEGHNPRICYRSTRKWCSWGFSRMGLKWLEISTKCRGTT